MLKTKIAVTKIYYMSIYHEYLRKTVYVLVVTSQIIFIEYLHNKKCYIFQNITNDTY